jgi:hypothetical protein
MISIHNSDNKLLSSVASLSAEDAHHIASAFYCVAICEHIMKPARCITVDAVLDLPVLTLCFSLPKKKKVCSLKQNKVPASTQQRINTFIYHRLRMLQTNHIHLFYCSPSLIT